MGVGSEVWVEERLVRKEDVGVVFREIGGNLIMVFCNYFFVCFIRFFKFSVF